jgi:tRNA(fMet)-specific endonuclease VapC
MYLLDTNVFSEITKPFPNKKVIETYHYRLNQIYLATTVWQELSYGYQILPEGRKKQDIQKFLTSQIVTLPHLNYTKACADIHATIRAQAKSAGTPIAFVDSQIAAIAMANDMVLITRNIKNFAAITGLKLANWFE